MIAVSSVKACKRAIADTYAQPDNLRGLLQVLSTLLPLSLLWYAVSQGVTTNSAGLLIVVGVMTLFLIRLFVLMHDCGHGSLFRNRRLNQAAGFIFGVVSGMPQYVWSQHHRFHHTTNGNWAKYRGPLAILSVDEYDALSGKQQRAYVRARQLCMAPIGGFVYLILNPRLNWFKGLAALLAHVVSGKRHDPSRKIMALKAEFHTRYWSTPAELSAMTWTNLAVLGGYILMSAWLGPAQFFLVYLLSTAFAGGAAIVLFTVQHNFEHAYASGDEGWDYETAAIHGTSYLKLPAWMNWFTASIGYHHVHHLSARIPNYQLAACHARHAELFEQVKRLGVQDISNSLKYLLWDQKVRRLISIAEHEASPVAV